MQFDTPLIKGLLIKRYKRFLADISLTDTVMDSDDTTEKITTVYCPNTGSMKNCQPPGARVWCSLSDNKKRKHALTWEIVEVPAVSDTSNEKTGQMNHLVGINTHRANSLVEEAINKDIINELKGYTTLCREVKYGTRSRIDFVLKDHPKQPDCYIEVKNVTLGEADGKGLFPDAVTSRGTRHLHELIKIKQQGMRAVLFFCVQHTGIRYVTPATEIDPQYSDALIKADAAGVEILAYSATVTPTMIQLTQPLPVRIPSKTSCSYT